MRVLPEDINWGTFRQLGPFRTNLEARRNKAEGELKEAYVRILSAIKLEAERFDEPTRDRYRNRQNISGGRNE